MSKSLLMILIFLAIVYFIVAELRGGKKISTAIEKAVAQSPALGGGGGGAR